LDEVDGPEELAAESKELVEKAEELVLVVTEEDAELVEEAAADAVLEAAADGVLEDEDEVRVKMVLDVIPRLLEGEADDDAEKLELELLVDDSGMVALMELFDEESDKDGEREELLVDDGTELFERPVLLEARPLLLKLSALLDKSELLEVTELLELFGLAELLAKLRDEDSELDGDAIELLLADVRTELVLEPAAEVGIAGDVLEILGENGEEACDPVDRVVSDEGGEETVEDMGNNVE
jgi:hypothetical protein